MVCFKVILAILFTTRCFAVLPHYERWLDNFEQAKEIALKQNRPLLIAFLGPQWCPYSDELEDKILQTNSFLAALQDKVIFLRVDIPEGYEEDAQTLQLRQNYNIDSCPTLILVEPNGREIAKLEAAPVESKQVAQEVVTVLASYTEVSDAKSINTLKEEQLKDLYARAGKLADSTFKKALLERGLKEDKSAYFLLQQYGELLVKQGVKNRESKILRNRIVARDLKNEKGCRRELAVMDFESLSTGSYQLNARAVVKPLVDYLQKFGSKDPENAWELELKVSQYLFSRDLVKEALKHANASLKLAPEAERKEIAKSVEYLETLSIN